MTSKPKTGRMTIRNAVDARRFLMVFDHIEKPFTLAWTPGVKRTLSQNALLHMWFDEIAKHHGDRSATEVKGECHHEWGLTIRLRDPQFAWIWDRTGAHLTYEQQCRLLASEALGVSSKMSKAELSEYMDAMRRHYDEIGIRLTDPEAMKYEQEMQ